MSKRILFTLITIFSLTISASAQKVASTGVSVMGGSAVSAYPEYFADSFKQSFGFSIAYDHAMTDNVMLQIRYSANKFEDEIGLEDVPLSPHSSWPYGNPIETHSLFLNFKMVKDNETEYFLPFFCFGAGIVDISGGLVGHGPEVYRSDHDEIAPGANMVAGFEFKMHEKFTFVFDGAYTAAFAKKGTLHYFPVNAGVKWMF